MVFDRTRRFKFRQRSLTLTSNYVYSPPSFAQSARIDVHCAICSLKRKIRRRRLYSCSQYVISASVTSVQRLVSFSDNFPNKSRAFYQHLIPLRYRVIIKRGCAKVYLIRRHRLCRVHVAEEFNLICLLERINPSRDDSWRFFGSTCSLTDNPSLFLSSCSRFLRQLMQSEESNAKQSSPRAITAVMLAGSPSYN